MIAAVSFEVPGNPHAKQRHRMTRSGIAFTPKETVNAETFVRLTAAPHFSEPFRGAVALDITAVFEPPKSWSRAKTRRTLGSPHCQRPDLDNVQKSVSDALNGVAYADDGQVAEVSCRKRWGPVAKTIVTVRSLAVAVLFAEASE